MKRSWRVAGISGLLAVICTLIIAGCAPKTTEQAPAEPTAVSLKIPAGVELARRSVVDYVREGANCMVPPEGAGWHTVEDGLESREGYDIYRFGSDECVVTVTHPTITEAEHYYHVALGNSLTGFCWQVLVDENGKVLQTGSEAQEVPGLGNPAKMYCEEHGYQFEMRERKNGTPCGVCIFDDDSDCNAWAFFHGVCRPDDMPAQES